MIEALWCEEAVRRGAGAPARARPVAFGARGRRFLYDPNDMRLFRCDPGAERRTLDAAGAFPTEKPQFALGPARVRMVVLVLTHRCNLRCRYCFHHDRIGAAEAEPEVMPLATAEAGLGLVPPGGDFTVGFFGGEPLLYPDRLREVVAAAEAMARHRGVRARFSLTTNATLLDDETAAFLDAHGFRLIVSCDGPPGLHDAARPLAGGAGSYAATRAGLDAIADHPRLAAGTTLRGTYTGGGASLVARLAHLNDLAEALGLGNVSVEPADLTEGCAGGGARPVRITRELVAEYFDAAAWFVERLREGRRPRFHHLAVRMGRLLRRSAAPSECGAGCGYATVGPGGVVYACHREGKSALGHVATGVDTEAQAPWRDNRYYARDRCPTCWLRNVCGGGCRWLALERHGDTRRPDPLGCGLTGLAVRAAAWTLSELTDAERRTLATG